MLPAPRLFYKWKERHQVCTVLARASGMRPGLCANREQVRFQFTPGGVVLHQPAAFTTCIQEAADGGWWMFPSSESDEWLCAKRKAAV